VVIAASGIRELDHLVDRETVGAGAARALADKFVRTPARGEGDDAVVAVALREAALVVTADRGLQERLRREGVTVLAPRDRHRLEVRPAHPERPAGQPPPRRKAAKPRPRYRARGNG
jgi:rRNA-processing protein FCF1